MRELFLIHYNSVQHVSAMNRRGEMLIYNKTNKRFTSALSLPVRILLKLTLSDDNFKFSLVERGHRDKICSEKGLSSPVLMWAKINYHRTD